MLGNIKLVCLSLFVSNHFHFLAHIAGRGLCEISQWLPWWHERTRSTLVLPIEQLNYTNLKIMYRTCSRVFALLLLLMYGNILEDARREDERGEIFSTTDVWNMEPQFWKETITECTKIEASLYYYLLFKRLLDCKLLHTTSEANIFPPITSMHSIHLFKNVLHFQM